MALASALLAMAAATLSCSGEVEPERSSPAILEGSWQAELLLGEEILPFRLELSPGGAVAGRAEGAGATVVITDLELRARAWVLVLGEEGTELVGRLSPDAGKLEGFWRPRQGRQGPEVPFVAMRDAGRRTDAPSGRADVRRWSGTVQLGGASTAGRLELRLADGTARGRVELPGGDVVLVEGRLENGRLLAHGFDGRRAVLLSGAHGGRRLVGDVRTGTGVTGSWSAEPAG